MKSIIAKALAGIAVLSLAACAVQPETHADLPKTVQTVAPDAWSVDAPQASVNADAWWNDFGDPVMHELVTSVLDGNLDVQAAAERVKQAQSIATQRHADLLPELDAVARAADTRQNTPPPLGYVRQAGVGLAVVRDTSRLLPGDLLTFSKGKKGVVSHVGIYIGDGKFIHASSVAGKVIESKIDRPSSPLIKIWRGARRMLSLDDSVSTVALRGG